MTDYIFVSSENAIRGMDPQFHRKDTLTGSNRDWRHYISEPIQKIWDTFSQEQRHALIETAEEACLEASLSRTF